MPKFGGVPAVTSALNIYSEGAACLLNIRLVRHTGVKRKEASCGARQVWSLLDTLPYRALRKNPDFASHVAQPPPRVHVGLLGLGAKSISALPRSQSYSGIRPSLVLAIQWVSLSSLPNPPPCKMGVGWGGLPLAHFSKQHYGACSSSEAMATEYTEAAACCVLLFVQATSFALTYRVKGGSTIIWWQCPRGGGGWSTASPMAMEGAVRGRRGWQMGYWRLCLAIDRDDWLFERHLAFTGLLAAKESKRFS